MKQDQKQGKKNQTGAIGEEIACKYLKNKGYTVVEQNYLKKWGEIDVVARETTRNGSIMRFVEVKTVSHETKDAMQTAISRGTHRPEENVHLNKIKRLNRAIESWLAENNCSLDWEIDVIAVRIVPREKCASVKYLKNVT